MKLRNWLALFRQVHIRLLEKGEIIVQQGSTQKEVFFIRKGLIRSYTVNEKGEEITFHLFPEYHILGNVHSIVFDEPSHFTYEALEPGKVYVIDYETYFNLTAQNSDMLELNRRFFGKRIMKQAFQRMEGFVLLSPEERYLKYLKEYPNVVGRAPDKYIAHVLGITPVSLSRIKGRLASKK